MTRRTLDTKPSQFSLHITGTKRILPALFLSCFGFEPVSHLSNKGYPGTHYIPQLSSNQSFACPRLLSGAQPFIFRQNLILLPQLVSNLQQSSCLRLLSTGIAGMSQYVQVQEEISKQTQSRRIAPLLAYCGHEIQPYDCQEIIHEHTHSCVCPSPTSLCFLCLSPTHSQWGYSPENGTNPTSALSSFLEGT